MLYHFYEWNHALLAPWRAVADATRLAFQNPLNPLAYTQGGRTVAAMAELFERTTRVYGKPEFGIHETVLGGARVPVADRVVWEKPFCRLLHFERELPASRTRRDPRFLLVAPMSGHYATLLRGTVEALLPYAEVYITDWTDARTVPVAAGRFDLDDYVDYLMEILRFLGPDTHIVGVCQPAVPVLMATARMEALDDPCAPATMTLMGGPIDTRVNPTAVNKLAQDRGVDWFRDHAVTTVPFPQPGFGREVYPGFLQLTGFMSMNLDRHLTSHKDFFWHLVRNDGDGAAKHRVFYDEYLAVMDLTAEFYLQTVEEVFVRHSLPRGLMRHRGEPVDLSAIRRTALLTVEGENDDISGAGQTEAAHGLCSSIPSDRKHHYLQPAVGHYGVFNGSRFRAEIAPRMVDFALTYGTTHTAARPVPGTVVPDAVVPDARPGEAEAADGAKRGNGAADEASALAAVSGIDAALAAIEDLAPGETEGVPDGRDEAAAPDARFDAGAALMNSSALEDAVDLRGREPERFEDVVAALEAAAPVAGALAGAGEGEPVAPAVRATRLGLAERLARAKPPALN